MIVTLTLNPALDKTVEIAGVELGSVNRIQSARTDGGGKGINVSKVLKSMGQSSVAMGILGGNNGKAVAEYVKSLGIDSDFTFVDDETRVNLKIIDTVNNVNTDINESGPNVSQTTIDTVQEKLCGYVSEGDIVVLSGSTPQGVSADIYFHLTTELKKKGVKVFLDVDGDKFKKAVHSAPYLIKPNIAELEAYVGKPLKAESEILSVCNDLLDMGIERIVVSLGGDGALFVSKASVILGHGLPVSVRSTVGAGDSLVASLVYSLVNGHSIEQTVVHAIATSAANVTTSGTQPAEYGVIKELMDGVIMNTRRW